MKKTFTTAFLTLASVMGFAQDAFPISKDTLPSFTEVKPVVLKEKTTHSFGYLRMGISDSQLPTKDNVQVLPGFGLGYRLASGASAIDLSASFNRRETRNELSKESTYTYTLPKANYLYYISPAKNNSFYAGAGLAWGGVKTKEDTEFHGLIPNVAVGYEMNRNATLHSFVQFDVSQAAIAGIQKGALPKPFAELSLGAGF